MDSISSVVPAPAAVAPSAPSTPPPNLSPLGADLSNVPAKEEPVALLQISLGASEEEEDIGITHKGKQPPDHPDPPKSKPPKSKPKPRSPSPPPPTLPPPAPITVRLNIPLGGPGAYSVNILELAKATGQRHPTPPPVRRDSFSGSDDDDDDDERIPPPPLNGSSDKPPARKKKRIDPNLEYYDIDDPFIDDSDLGVDAPTHFAQTKQKGFYVNSGEVSLIAEQSPAKAKSKKKKAPLTFLSGPSSLKLNKPSNLKPRTKTFYLFARQSSYTTQPSSDTLQPPISTPNHDSNMSSILSTPAHDKEEKRARVSSMSDTPPPQTVGEGTRDSPIALFEDGSTPEDPDGDDPSPMKRLKLENGNGSGMEHGKPPRSKKEPSAEANGNDHSKKRKRSSTSDMPSFSPELEAQLQHLRELVHSESFAVKNKFPTTLRAPLAEVALKAVELDEYDENFYRILPEIFPYNKFTMTKLVRRLIYDRHLAIIAARMEELLDELGTTTAEGLETAKQQHLDEVTKWEEKQEKKRQVVEAEPSTAAPSPAPTDPDVTINGDSADGPSAPAPAANKKDKEEKAPPQRFRWSDAVKRVCWALVSLSNEQAAMTNAMHEYEPENHGAVSEQGMRKLLYQKMVIRFPEGWQTTTMISREISNMKKKVQLAEEQDDDPE